MFSVFGYFCMHLGFFAFLRLGQFGFVTTGTILGLIPTWFWTTILFKRLHTPARKEFKLLYHGNCSRCFYTAHIIKEFFLIKETEVVKLHNDIEEPCQCGNHCNWRLEDNYVLGKSPFVNNLHFLDIQPSRTVHPVWLVAQDHNGQVLKNWNAVIAVCEVAPLLWPVAKLLKMPLLKPVARTVDLTMQIVHSHIPLLKKSDDLEEVKIPKR
jgi:hypothetical protein